MSFYRINLVDGIEEARAIRNFNAAVPEFPELTDDHLKNGWWFLIFKDFGFGRAIGFGGLVTFLPGGLTAYAKRAYVALEHRGNGLQVRMLSIRCEKAKRLGFKQIVSETTNLASAGNFIKAGFSAFIPEQPWGPEGSLYFTKSL